jgi:plasmid replication initiation protein
MKKNLKKIDTTDIVKFENTFDQFVKLKNYTSTELDMFFSILRKVKNQGTNVIEYDFKELRETIKYTSRDRKNFIIKLKNVNRKLLQSFITVPNEYDDEDDIGFFSKFSVRKSVEKLVVSVNKDFVDLLNNFDQFTEFLLSNFVSFRSKYSKLLYKTLMQFKSTGKLYIKMEDFREKLDIPKSYRLSEITEQVLEVAKKELSTVLENFEYKKIKKGRAVVRIDFTFKPIKNFENPEVIEIIEDDNIENNNENATERIEILIEILEEKIAAEENKINKLQLQIKEFKEKEYIDAADESINRDIENYLENNIVESNKKIENYKQEIEDYKNQLTSEIEDYNSLIEKILKEKNVYTKEVKEKILELKETNTDEEIYKEILKKIEEIKTKNIKNISGYLNTCIKNLEIKKIEVIEKKDITPAEEVNKEKIEELGLINLLNKYK